MKVDGTLRAATFFDTTKVTTSITSAEVFKPATLTLRVVNSGGVESNDASLPVLGNQSPQCPDKK